jgi:CheY-like chemotaxis protein
MVGQLLDNAVDALEGAAGRVAVQVIPAGTESAEEADLNYAADELAWLEVRDTGRGVPANVRPRLFEPFFTTRPGKRGLGLSMVLGVIRGHRGAIRVQSTPGEGTGVRVGLPVSAAPAEAPAKPTVAANRRPEQPTVLLADDEETVLDVVTRLLQSQGCQVIPARDGEQALQRYRESAGAVSLALIDMTMPRQDGEQVVRHLRALAPDLPVVLMSGFPETDLGPRYADLGLAGYLQKPFRLPAIVALLRELGVVG